MSDNREIYNRFTDFFGEAFFYYDLAKREGTSAQHRVTFIRTTILYCAFALEAVANSLISEIDFSRKPKQSFDRNLSVIGKLQLYHLFRTQKPREFGHYREETESIREIIRFRDNQVHSKIGARPLDLTDEGYLFAPDIEYSRHLKLPEYPYFLTNKNGLASMKALDEFLAIYLLDWCELSVEESTHLLSHRMEHDGISTKFPLTSMYFRDFQHRFKEEGIDLKFMNHRAFNANRSVM